MIKAKKTISIILAGAVITTCLFGCSGNGEGQQGPGGDGIKGIISEESKNSGIAYEESMTGYDSYDENMSVAVDSKSAGNMGITDDQYGSIVYDGFDYDTREYDYLPENKFVSISDQPLSTFAADRDTASYSNVRSYIEAGELPPAGAVRIEEMINYFNYDYKSEPAPGEKFSVYTEYTDCPWNKDTRLMMVGINTEDIDFKEKKPSNLVFLIDTSGSMYSENKLPLVQKSFKLLTENLDEKDRVSIVTYAGNNTVVLSGTSGADKYTITEALDSMTADGCTNGGDAIISAYELAEKYFIDGGNNRVILATDGDLNVGITSESDLVNLISEEKDSGIFLSVLGFGQDNLKDNKLEALADNGNGFYSYIDSEYEAKKALVSDMGGNLHTVAKDVKFQVEFNPANVKGYRQIGYENRALADEDFANDAVDGGEIGAGHMVTALYEIVPADSDFDIPHIEKKYSSDQENGSVNVDELATIGIRYKEPDSDTSSLVTKVVKCESYNKEMSSDMSFASSVAAYGMLLKGSSYSGTSDFDMVLELAGVNGENVEYVKDEYKAQFSDMVKKTSEMLDKCTFN